MWPKLFIIAITLAASTASACPKCGLFGSRCVLRQNVVVQPVAVQQYAYPQQISYFVGAPIRVEAIVQKSLQENPEYAEFQRFRAWKQNLEANRQSTPAEKPDRKWYQTPENEVQHEDGWEDHIRPLGSIRPDGTIQPVSQLALKQKCGGCHGGDAPKKGLLLDGTAKLNCDQTLKAMRAIQSGKMPPKVKLTGEEAGEVFHELLDLAEVK